MHMIMPTRVGFVDYTNTLCQDYWHEPGMFLNHQVALALVVPGESFEIDSPSFFRGESGPGDHPVAHAKLVAVGDGVPGIASNGWGAPNRIMESGKYDRPSSWWRRCYDWNEDGSVLAYVWVSAYSSRTICFSASLVVGKGYWKGTNSRQKYTNMTTTFNVDYSNVAHDTRPKLSGTWKKWEWSQATFGPLASVASDIVPPPWEWSNSKLDLPTIMPYLEDMMEVVYEYGKRYRDYYNAGLSVPQTSDRALTLYGYDATLPVARPDLFHFNELMLKYYGEDPMLARRSALDNSGYFLDAAMQRAYLDAVDNVPRLSDNTIANISELCSFIVNLVVRHRIEMPSSLSDAWLQYRYQYTTTKLDAREAIEFVHRHMDLKHLEKFSCHGVSHVEFKGVRGTVKCGFNVTPKDLRTLNRVWHALYTYGLEPNFYVVWDLIPYSFIVDWIIPVGDMAQAEDAQRNFKAMYDVSNLNYSLSYDYMKDGHQWHCYTRWQAPAPKELSGLYYFEREPKSKKVWGYRALDAGSLILG